MNLPISTVNVDSGLDWELNLNSALSIIDGHNHSPGSGAQINPSGLNINSDLPMGVNNLTLVRSVRFSNQVSPIALPTDLVCLYGSGTAGDLWFNDGSGNQIQMTAGGTVNATSSGISSGSASASFNAGVLIVNAASNTPANVQGASFLFGNNVAASKFLTLSPPSSMGANFSLTLPNIPAATSFMTIDTSGNMSGSVSTAGGISGSNIVSNINLPGSAVQENGKNLVVSSTNATTSLSIIRGIVTSGGTIVGGEGFSVTPTSTGIYTISFTNAYSDAPAMTASILSPVPPGQALSISVTPNPTASLVYITNASNTPVDSYFTFIACGAR